MREFSAIDLKGAITDITFPVSQFQETTYRIERWEASKEQKQDPNIHRLASSQLFTHKVIFESLSESSFSKFKETWWKDNPLKYEARPFQLSEFLRPAMQATLNADFRDQDGFIKSKAVLTLPDADTRDKSLSRIGGSYFIRPRYSVRSNCWTTAYEMLRQREDNFLHFFSSDIAIWPYLASDRGLRQVIAA